MCACTHQLPSAKTLLTLCVTGDEADNEELCSDHPSTHVQVLTQNMYGPRLTRLHLDCRALSGTVLNYLK